MKTQVLLPFLLLSAVTYSQTDKEDKKTSTRLVASHIKSMTQTAYPYEYDINSGKYRQSMKGTKVATQSYDVKGNTTEEVDYDQYGNVSSKTASIFDSRGNATTVTSYGSDGTVQSKVVYQYNADTMTQVKVYLGNGSLDHENYCVMKHNSILGKEIYSAVTSMQDTNHESGVVYRTNDLIIHNAKDSGLVGCNRHVYDKKGNLIEFATWKFQQSAPGQYYAYDQKKETYTYNTKGNKIETDSYNGDQWEGYHKLKYDENGHLMEDEQSGAVTVYKCDAHGNFTEAIMYDGNNNPTGAYKYSYQYFVK
jgi:YD repeat-containing protein